MTSPTRKKKAATTYHHGDLRNVLLGVARLKLTTGEYESLSLRELARLAGVSPNAPYRHFASKDEILAEVAAQGFSELSAHFDKDAYPEPRERLARMGDIYTRFAMDQPALYRVMFGADKHVLMEFEVLGDAGRGCFGRLVQATAEASGRADADDPLMLQRALAVWSIVHGWSRLAIDGVTHFLPEDSMPSASAVVRSIVASWD